MNYPQECAWGELRSACAALDWRRAWVAVGTDHAGTWTAGELYLLDKARRARAVAAALHHWRAEYKEALSKRNAERLRSARAWKRIPPMPLLEDAWPRIKLMATWESDAVAQHSEALRRTMAAAILESQSMRATSMTLTIGGQAVELQAPNFETLGVDEGAPNGDRTAAVYARRESVKGKFQMDIGDDELPDELVQLRAKVDRCIDTMRTIRRIKAVAADRHTPPVKLIGGDDDPTP